MRKGFRGSLKKRYTKLFTLHFSLFASVIMAAVITGCGYKPVAQYGRELLPDPVYVEVRLSGKEPQHGVYLKDELLRLLRNRFHERVTTEPARAVSRLRVERYRISYDPLLYDRDGYVTRYRAKVTIDLSLRNPKGTLKKIVTATEDVNVQPGSLLSSEARDEAVRAAIRKAMDQFVAYAAQKGYAK